MKALHHFDIGLAQLSNKQHEFEFELGNAFFELFDQNLVNGGNLKAEVTLLKSELLLNFTIRIFGTVNLTCDRSLDTFDHPIRAEKKLVFKYGETDEELSDEIVASQWLASGTVMTTATPTWEITMTSNPPWPPVDSSIGGVSAGT